MTESNTTEDMQYSTVADVQRYSTTYVVSCTYNLHNDDRQ